MAWDQPIDPSKLYQRWETVNGLFAPDSFDPWPSSLEGGSPEFIAATEVASVLSLVTGRAELWATICLGTGYASQSEADPAAALWDLALSTTDQWAPENGAGQFAAVYDNLGWKPRAIGNGARVLVAAVSPPLITLASFSIVDVETCMDTCGDDMAALAECVKAALAAQQRIGT